MLQANINANSFARTFYFFQRTEPPHKKNEKSLQAAAPNSTDICASLNRYNIGRNV